MDSAQVEADTAALQKYVERLKGITDTTTAAQEKTKAFDEILGDSSQIAKDVARNTNNLDDVMKVYTASTRTATSVAKAFGTTKNAPAFKPERKTLFEWQIKSKYLNFFQCPGCNLVRRTEKGRLRRRGWGLRWEKAQKGGKGTNLRGFFED